MISLKSILALAVLWRVSLPGHAFAPSKSTKRPVLPNTNTITKLGATEKTVREELQEKAELVDAKDEIKYHTDGEGVSPLITKKISGLYQKIERATKPRAYPLFLAEKGAMFLEDAVSPLIKLGRDASSERREIKERIVILGTGWGCAAFLKDIDTTQYDVTVISPRNHFLFTPMLAGASVGTVEFRSITQSIREINLDANYLEGTAIDIDTKAKRILCESVVCEGNTCDIDEFTVEYDKLIMSVGAQTNTFGIPGVRENCCFLKQVEDARRIRTAIVNLFERANLPDLTDDQRKAILTFAVIGAGPTGVEFAR
jgi:hypothetical protein